MISDLKYLQTIYQRCLSCHQCTNTIACGKPLGLVAKFLLEDNSKIKDYVFSCHQCGYCLKNCPNHFDIKEFIFHARSYLHSSSCYHKAQYNSIRVDQEDNLFNKLKAIWQVTYDDCLKKPGTCQRLFLPSCHLVAKFPDLAKKTTIYLQQLDLIDSMTATCCGNPLYMAGLKEEFQNYIIKLDHSLKDHSVQEIITPCPNCYNFCLRMQTLGYLKNIEIKSLPEQLAKLKIKIDYKQFSQIKTVSFHDSCPDRYSQKFGLPLRQLFRDFDIIELPHSLENTLCCGGGGLASMYHNNYTKTTIQVKVNDYNQVKSDLVITSCFNCLDTLHDYLPIKHFLELLVIDADFNLYNDIKMKLTEK